MCYPCISCLEGGYCEMLCTGWLCPEFQTLTPSQPSPYVFCLAPLSMQSLGTNSGQASVSDITPHSGVQERSGTRLTFSYTIFDRKGPPFTANSRHVDTKLLQILGMTDEIRTPIYSSLTKMTPSVADSSYSRHKRCSEGVCCNKT